MKAIPYWASRLFPTGPAVNYKAVFGDHILPDTDLSAVDTFDFYMVTGGLGEVTVADNNGTLCTISNAAGASYKKTTCTRAAASTVPIAVTRTTAGGIYFGSVDICFSTTPAVRFVNSSAYGTTAGAQASTTLPARP